MSQFEKEAASGRFFFRKENRILKRADFQRVYNHGRPIRRSLVHVFIMPPPDQGPAESASMAIPGPTCLGITATKKVGNAVKRNRARRLVRESFRHALPDLKPGYRIVVNVMRAAATAHYAEVDKQLREVFRQSGLLMPENRSS